MTELYLPNGDMDLVVLDEQQEQTDLLKKTKELIDSCPDLFSNITITKSIKIPLVKFTEKKSNLEFVISFNN